VPDQLTDSTDSSDTCSAVTGIAGSDITRFANLDGLKPKPIPMAFHPNYLGPNSTTYHWQPTPSTIVRNSEALGGGHHAVTEVQVDYSIHTYNMEEYALVSINSLAGSTQGAPLVYLGEQITGTVEFPEHRLHEVQRIVVAVSWLLISL
jgi:hypothetical protein